MLWVRENVHKNLFQDSVEAFFYWNKPKNWLLFGSYNSSRSEISTHFEKLNKILALYFPRYDKLIVLGNLNDSVNDSYLSVFLEAFNSESLIK